MLEQGDPSLCQFDWHLAGTMMKAKVMATGGCAIEDAIVLQ